MRSRIGRAIVLRTMLQSASLVQRTTPPSGELRFTEEIPATEYSGILWRNRGAIRELLGIRASDAITTHTATGDAVLTVLGMISDERDRAAVLGYFLATLQPQIRAVNLGEVFQAVLGATARGEACPICGKVHAHGETHKGEQ